jgi:hypothetical protein
MAAKTLQTWDVWYPQASATGLLSARCRIEPAGRVVFHAPPKVATVEVFDGDHKLVARGQDLSATAQSPMCEFRIEGERVVREEMWPTESDYGATVLLPGGEAGILKSWWNAEDRKEWRWEIEFYNSIR